MNTNSKKNQTDDSYFSLILGFVGVLIISVLLSGCSFGSSTLPPKPDSSSILTKSPVTATQPFSFQCYTPMGIMVPLTDQGAITKILHDKESSAVGVVIYKSGLTQYIPLSMCTIFSKG